MNKRLLAPCMATLIVGSTVAAQGIPGNPIQRSADVIGRTGQALGRTAGAVGDTIGNSVGRVTRGVQNTTQRVLRPNAPVVNGTRGYSANATVYGHASTHHAAPTYSSYHHGSHHAGGIGHQSGVVHAQTTPHATSQPIAHTAQSYRLMHDAIGREYICVAGERVYFDGNVQSQGTAQSQRTDDPNERYEAGYGGYDAQEKSFDAPRTDGAENNTSQSQENWEPNARSNNEGENVRPNDVRSDVNESIDANADTQVDAAFNSGNARAEADNNVDARSSVNAGTSEDMLRQSTTASGQQNVNANNDSFGGDSDLGSAAKDAVTGDLGNE